MCTIQYLFEYYVLWQRIKAEIWRLNLRLITFLC